MWDGGAPIKYFTSNAVKGEKRQTKTSEQTNKKTWWAKRLRCSQGLVLITSEKAPFTRLSTPQMLTGHFAFPHWILFYCSFTSLLKWRLHHDKLVRIRAYSRAVKALYHADSLARERPGDLEMLLPWPEHHSRDKREREPKVSWTEVMYFCWDEHNPDKTEWAQDVFSSINIINHGPSVLALFIWSPGIQQLFHLISQLWHPHVLSFDFIFLVFCFHPLTQGRHTKITAAHSSPPDLLHARQRNVLTKRNP